MHIPKGTTAELELTTFREALAAANTPNPDYDIEKWIYAPNFYSEYRYILGTRGEKPLIFLFTVTLYKQRNCHRAFRYPHSASL